MPQHRFRHLYDGRHLNAPPAPAVRPEAFLVVPLGTGLGGVAFAVWQQLLYAWAWQQAVADNTPAYSEDDDLSPWN